MIIIPAAGDGKRFREAGYEGPKHMIPLGGRPMIEWVVENVAPLDQWGQVVVASKDEVGPTKGAIDTVLKAWALHGGSEYNPLVIANCDQLLKFPADIPMKGDGVVFTFRSSNSAHSYVVDGGPLSAGFINSIVEKPESPPSNRAVSGVYMFNEAGDFLEAARQVQEPPPMPGEQYISSALSVMLDWGYRLYAVDAPTAILGTPEDFQRFEVALSCVR